MKSALTADQRLVDPAVMDVGRFGNRDRCSARCEHFGLIGSAAAGSGRPASGSHGAGGCRGPDQGGTGGPIGWESTDRRSSLVVRPAGTAVVASPCLPAGPFRHISRVSGTTGGFRSRSRPGERRVRPGIRRWVAGAAAGRASRLPLRGAVAASVRRGRPELGCQPLVLRAAVRPASAAG